jgi:hypothetical protein
LARIGIEVSGINSLIKGIEQEIETIVKNTADDFERTVRAETPIRTGNARRNWQQSKRANKRGFEVENRVPYIERLEQGHSKQAPRGMIGPTLTKINRRSR